MSSLVDGIIAALTNEVWAWDEKGNELPVPLLDLSIAHDLRRIEATLGAKGGLLSAIATSIDEALLLAQELKLNS